MVKKRRLEHGPSRWILAALVLGLVVSVGFRAGARPAEGTVSEQDPAIVGLKARPLPDTPMVVDTAEGMDIRVVVVTKALSLAWSLAFLPDGGMLVAQRNGQMRLIRDGHLDPQPVAGVPASRFAGRSGFSGMAHGLMDIALHPRFAENHFVYFTYSKPVDQKSSTVALARGRWDGRGLTDVTDVFVTGVRGSSRIAFAPDGTLFMSTSGQDPQDPNTLGGKILRLRDDGTVPGDNPFVGRSGHRPEVYSLGHRGILGLAIHPGTGEPWANENGESGGDELNIIRPGRNYGWPTVSMGRQYSGRWRAGHPSHGGPFERPVLYWTPSIGPSGLAFYTGTRLPKWKGNVFVGSLRFGQVPGTGHLVRVVLNEQMGELRQERLLTELRHRIRDVRQGPDGLLYLVTDEEEGAGVLRIEPAS